MTWALNRIEEIITDEKIACGLQRTNGYLFSKESEPSLHFLRDEVDAALRAGLTEVEIVSEMPFKKYVAARFGGQAQIELMPYLVGLVRAMRREQVELFTFSRVTNLKIDDNFLLTTEHGAHVNSRVLIIASNFPIFGGQDLIQKQTPQRSYVLEFESQDPGFPPGLFWDIEQPYHYIRSDLIDAEKGVYRVLVGGEDHPTGSTAAQPERWRQLENWSRSFIPGIGRLVNKWSGQILEPSDGIAFIGSSSEHDRLYLVSGDSGMGILYATLASELISDSLSGKSNPLAPFYDPKRVITTRRYLKNRGPKTSPKCTYDGSRLIWNAADLSWDCPNDGSRFSQDGEVLNAPATRSFAPSKDKSMKFLRRGTTLLTSRIPASRES